ncbi:uncharacterized protein [Watersipora subatra]|uniref:uncharacterized protein n=1 Tax=Watersipora subatra TaxID=2589382 RepID=UPI00355B1328
MGNAADKDHDLQSDFEDGEVLCDTIARDITYRRCSEGSLCSMDQQNRKLQRAVSRSASLRQDVKPPETDQRRRRDSLFLLSEMEVKVDGKKVKLVPRESVIKKKGISTLKGRLIYLRSKKVARKNKLEKSAQTKSVEHLALPPEYNYAKRPSFDEAMSRMEKREKNRVGERAQNVWRHSQVDIIRTDLNLLDRRPKSVHINNNNTDNACCDKITGNRSYFEPMFDSDITDLSKKVNRLRVTSCTTNIIV